MLWGNVKLVCHRRKRDRLAKALVDDVGRLFDKCGAFSPEGDLLNILLDRKHYQRGASVQVAVVFAPLISLLAKCGQITDMSATFAAVCS